MDSVYKITGVVQNYAWGGTSFIPQLLHVTNENNKPFAEYWLGAHPKASSVLEGGIVLQQLINEHPKEILGNRIAGSFGSLPYLFKILDVRQMLSIQVHPSKEAAIEEYRKENEKGIALTAPDRNYKDENHKPELMVALSDFWLLHGFKEEGALRQILKKVPQLSFLESIFDKGGYQGLYEEVMTMPQEKVDAVLSPLLEEIIPIYHNGHLKKDDEHFWAARAAVTFCKNENKDRGIFSIYLFNLLHLKAGEGIYQAAGLPHAYLEGQNVEVMANSDNVLRAGLTDKHIDVPELMKHVKFRATHPAIIAASDEREQHFDAPVQEFSLTRFTIDSPVYLTVESALILFVYEGEANLLFGGKSIALNRGEAALIIAGRGGSVQPVSSSITFFSVCAPTDKN